MALAYPITARSHKKDGRIIRFKFHNTVNMKPLCKQSQNRTNKKTKANQFRSFLSRIFTGAPKIFKFDLTKAKRKTELPLKAIPNLKREIENLREML